MITLATPADLPQIVEMGRRHFTAAEMPGDFNAEAFAGFVTGMIRHGAVFLSERGMIGGTLAPAYAAPGYLMAVEMFWWAEDGQGASLRKAFEAWAADMGADEVRLSAVTQHRGDAVGRMLERAGYMPREVSYTKGLR